MDRYPALERDILALYLSLWESGDQPPPPLGTPMPECLTWRSESWWEQRLEAWQDGRHCDRLEERAVLDARMVSAESARQSRLSNG